MDKVVVIICCIFLFSSCRNEKAKPLNYSSEEIVTLQTKVYAGDTSAYIKLKTVYLDYSPEQLLFWAMIMANKYDYSPAYLDVYYSIKESYERGGENFKNKDEFTRKILLEYLNRASEKGEKRANELLRELQNE